MIVSMTFWSFIFSSDSPLYMWCLDVKCFERSLSGQADASFFTFGQFCRFLRKLCSRAVLPKCIPGDMDWTGMLYLCPDDLKLLSCRDFLHRLKLVTDIDLVCKAKIRQSRSDPNISANEFSGLLVAERDNFATKARGYFVFLLETILRDVHLTADIVHGLACFDPHTLVSLPMEQVTFCFGALFQAFALRGWVQRSSEADYRDEYMEFVDHFRANFPQLKDVPGQMKDMVGFLVALPALRSRKSLFHLFRLSCLCLTESGIELPAIKFHEVDTSKPKCRFTDMLLPAQSYLANCSQSVSYCTSESSIAKFREMDSQFSSGQFAGDPWTHVDAFGRSAFQKSLMTTFKGLKPTPVKVIAGPSRCSSVSSTAGHKVVRESGSSQKPAFFGSIIATETSKAEESPKEGSSKD